MSNLKTITYLDEIAVKEIETEHNSVLEQVSHVADIPRHRRQTLF